MRVWSRGLGRVELAADLKKAQVSFDGDSLYIVGRTEPPVKWDFVVRLNPCETEAIMKLILNRQGGRFISRFLRLRTLSPDRLGKNYKEATTMRTGVRPDQDYASLLGTAAKRKA